MRVVSTVENLHREENEKSVDLQCAMENKFITLLFRIRASRKKEEKAILASLPRLFVPVKRTCAPDAKS